MYIRYGSHSSCEGVGLNSLQSVKLASNKLAALLHMSRLGVRTPSVFQSDCGVADVDRILRKSARHSGSDSPMFVGARQKAKCLCDYDYSMEFIHKKSEFRVHVCFGEPICVQRKIKRRYEQSDPLIWSSVRGWRLVETRVVSASLLALAMKAVESIGLDFGAADIVQSKDGEFYVIEVNTAPGLTPRRVSKYAEVFVAWSKNREVHNV